MFRIEKFKAVLRAMALLATLGVVPALTAQGSTTFAVATIPFTFRIGDHVLPSGKYHLRMSSEHILQLSGEDGAHFTMVRADEERSPQRNAVLLFRQGDMYELQEITLPLFGMHLYCAASHAHGAKGKAPRVSMAQVATVSLTEQEQ